MFLMFVCLLWEKPSMWTETIKEPWCEGISKYLRQKTWVYVVLVGERTGGQWERVKLLSKTSSTGLDVVASVRQNSKQIPRPRETLSQFKKVNGGGKITLRGNVKYLGRAKSVLSVEIKLLGINNCGNWIISKPFPKNRCSLSLEDDNFFVCYFCLCSFARK
jgi:hypothetical protein